MKLLYVIQRALARWIDIYTLSLRARLRVWQFKISILHPSRVQDDKTKLRDDSTISPVTEALRLVRDLRMKILSTIKKHAMVERKTSVLSFDGTRIHYATEGVGPCIVCSYGVICGSYHFKYQTSYFKDHYEMLHYDYRGHNKSSCPKNLEDLTIYGCALDLKAVLDDLGIETAVLMGHSMGSAVNLEFYRLFPERVKAMINICGSISSPLEIMFYTDITKALFELLKLGYLKYPNALNQVWQNLPGKVGEIFVSLLGHNIFLAQKEDIKFYIEGVKKHPISILLYFLQDYSEFNGFPICEKVTCPTLIIAGQFDHLTPKSYMEKLHKSIKTSELFIVPQGSHVSQWDMPEVVNLKIEKFLSNI